MQELNNNVNSERGFPGVQNKLINVDETIYATFTNTELFCWHAIVRCKFRPTLFLQQPSIGTKRHQEGKIYPHHEFSSRREKGLCFRCAEPLHLLHKCAYKSMWMTVLAEDLEEAKEQREAEEQQEIHAA